MQQFAYKIKLLQYFDIYSQSELQYKNKHKALGNILKMSLRNIWIGNMLRNLRF